MLKSPLLVATLGLATAAAAQPGAPPAPSQLKAQHQPSRGAPAARATPPDWSLPYAASITPAALQADLSVLASDEFEGRETGRKGQQLAAAYLAQAFAAAGLAGPVPSSDNPYLQHFTLNRIGLDPASVVKVGNRTFEVNKDFYVRLWNLAPAPAVVQPTFIGYGINTAGYADFVPAAPELTGKYLVLLLGEPLNQADQPLLGTGGQPSSYATLGFTEMMTRSPAMRTLLPRATLRIAPSAAAFAQVPQAYQGLFVHPDRLSFLTEPVPANAATNLFVVSPEMGAALLGTTPTGLARYRAAVAKAGHPIASPFKPAPMALQTQEKKVPFTTENVLGYLEGTDKKAEVLVISAHYDHIGVKNGVVYNGADDDGSGTVSVLALARAFAQAKRDGHGPRRSLLFVAYTGEEEDLLGSRYYTDHPVFALENTVANLHIDMLGRVDSAHAGKGDYVYVLGDDWISAELRALSEATNRQYSSLALDYAYNTFTNPAHLYRRSDHYNFAQHRVPVIFYNSGLHPDYHQPTDDVAKIDFPALTRRSQLVFHTAWALANRDARVALDAAAQPTGYAPAPADLARRTGTYASPQTPLKITLTADGAGLRAQTTDYQTFPLEPVGPGVFKFDQAGVRLEFTVDPAGFILKQSGGSYVFTRVNVG